jgi:hypothetical protein
MMTIKLSKLSAVLLSLIVLVSLSILPEAKADSNTDNTEIAEASRSLEYLAPIFAYIQYAYIACRNKEVITNG